MTLEESESDLSLGDEAPDFALMGADGSLHRLSEYADNDAVLVVFTCNHCPYAKAKFEELNHLSNAYDGLAVIGVNPNDADEYPEDGYGRMKEYVESGTIDYDAYLRDESQEVAEAYGAVCTPDPFLFRSDDGTFQLAYHGRLDDALNPDDDPERHYMREAVEHVLAGEKVPFAEEDLPSQGCSIKWRED